MLENQASNILLKKFRETDGVQDKKKQEESMK